MLALFECRTRAALYSFGFGAVGSKIGHVLDMSLTNVCLVNLAAWLITITLFAAFFVENYYSVVVPSEKPAATVIE
jgi:hypothetical protein